MRYSIELVVVRRMLGEMKISDLVESCKEFVWRNASYSMELVVVRRMLGKCKVSVCVGSCKDFVRRMAGNR